MFYEQDKKNLNKYKSLLSGVPIIGIVSKDLDRIKFLQKNRAFDDVLTKPFYLEDLVYLIRALFEKKRLEDDNSFTLGELCFYPDLKYFLNKSKICLNSKVLSMSLFIFY